MGETSVDHFSYTYAEETHTYDVTYELSEGSTSCEDGVTLTYTCTRCSYSYTTHTYWHETFEKEVYDLSEYGSVCGGKVKVVGCACGYYQNIEYPEHILCDMDREWCEFWVEGVDTSIGWTDAWIDKCAVTDPHACPFSVRYAHYYVREAGSCYAYGKEVYQFGYDAENGTYAFQIEIINRGYTAVIHDWNENQVDRMEDGFHIVGMERNCPTCGRYELDLFYYDENDETVKHFTEYRYFEKGEREIHEIHEYIFINGYDCATRSLYEERDLASDYHYWYEYQYTYPDIQSPCYRIITYTNSDGDNWSKEEASHHMTWDYQTIKPSTCTQYGDQVEKLHCYRCHYVQMENHIPIEPTDHTFIYIDAIGMYMCTICGLQNVNGATGDITMEDLTNLYGNGTHYVVGYWADTALPFHVYVSLKLHNPLEDGNDEVLLDGISLEISEGITGYAFLKEDVYAVARELGFDRSEYDVKFTFVPEGAGGQFDYALVFTEEQSTITQMGVYFTPMLQGESYDFVITPTVDGEWTFVGQAELDTVATLLNAEGGELTYSDDAYGNQFGITYWLNAGETYILRVRYYHSDSAGVIPVLITYS